MKQSTEKTNEDIDRIFSDYQELLTAKNEVLIECIAMLII